MIRRKILTALTLLVLLLGNCPVNKPSGKFFLVGGGGISVLVKKRFLELAGGKHANILVIPSASFNPEDPDFLSSWKVLANVEILHARTKQEAQSYSFYSRIRRATGVWMSGGDQKRLKEIYGNTQVVTELKYLLWRGGVVGGTSAGASIVGSVMPYGDTEMDGFGLINTFIFDQHFDTRKERIHRLNKLVKEHPGMVGVGIDESTALIIEGNQMSVIGNGGVYFARGE